MKKLLLIPLLLMGCEKKQSYLERLEHPKYKIGQTITVDRGFYKGCTLKVTKIDPRYSITIYHGTSNCPINGVSDEGTYRE